MHTQQSTTYAWVRSVLMVLLTLSRVIFVEGKLSADPWVGGVLLGVTDQGWVRWGKIA